MTKSIALVVMLMGCQVAQQDEGGADVDKLGESEHAVGGGGTQTVKVVNASSEPVPVTVANLPAAAPASSGFKTVLMYNQQTGQFPDFVVPSGQRIILCDIHASSLVPMGTVPSGGLWVGPLNLGGTGYLGAYEAALDFKLMSNFQGSQDRYATSATVYIVLEPGQHLSWWIRDRAGENVITPFGSMTGSLSISGDVVAAN